ncbi:hypothetical protein FB451DRAFT_1184474 [Mycena latifolia]|nr:hypothetical protein FB451DRAFT_1184474 [Mycena latifolia]
MRGGGGGDIARSCQPAAAPPRPLNESLNTQVALPVHPTKNIAWSPRMCLRILARQVELKGTYCQLPARDPPEIPEPSKNRPSLCKEDQQKCSFELEDKTQERRSLLPSRVSRFIILSSGILSGYREEK